MAKYLILIFGDPQQWDAMTPEEGKVHDAAHAAFAATAGSKILSGGQLEYPSMATTLRGGTAGGVIRTDGPFMETKEVLGGYYLIEAADLDDAVALASQLPEVRASHSGVEIRPLVDHG